jgi:hypothetical protein
VPLTTAAGPLEVIAVFPSGPLAGDISGWKTLTIKKK